MIRGQRYSRSEIIISYAGFLLIGFIWLGLDLTWPKDVKGPDLKCQYVRVWSVHQKLYLSLTPSSFTKREKKNPDTLHLSDVLWEYLMFTCAEWKGRKKSIYFSCFFFSFFSTMRCPMGWTLKCTNRYVSLWSFPDFTCTLSLDYG